MIRYLLLQNRAGKTRLAKYYIPLDDAQKHALEYEVHKLIANRDPKFTNFVEASCCQCRLVSSVSADVQSIRNGH
jgi:Clathrin adaptor complex small chain